MNKNKLKNIIELVVRKEVKKQLSEIFINEKEEIKLSETISKPTPKKVVKKTKKQYQGRSEITAQMSRHASIDTLNRHNNKPSIETKKQYAGKVSKVFKFIQRRSA